MYTIRFLFRADADSWAKVFDDPERDRCQKPHEVIMALRLAPDAKVADIGAGTGYFAARLAHMSPNGRIYAVDLEPDMVKYLAERAKREGLVNLLAVLAKADSDEATFQYQRERYRQMANDLGFEGHMQWAAEMV